MERLPRPDEKDPFVRETILYRVVAGDARHLELEGHLVAMAIPETLGVIVGDVLNSGRWVQVTTVRRIEG